MKKGMKIFLGVLAVIIIIAVGAVFYINSVLSIDKDEALLFVEQGTVNVYRGDETIVGTNELELKENDIIETVDNSKARVMLFNSIFVDLAANTKISLASLVEDNLKIVQESGQTWNKVTRLFGITNYEVETPNSVATVRGTEFEVSASEEESFVILVEGSVSVVNDQGQEIILNELGKVKATADSIEQQELTDEDMQRILEKTLETKKALENERFRIAKETVEKSDLVKNQIESLTGEDVNDQTMNDFFYDIDTKQTDINEVERAAYDKVPVLNKEIVTYVKDISNKIDEQQKLIDGMK